MHIDPTGWYPLEQHAPVREGWYEVQLVSGETAFAKYIDGKWTEKPPLVFTHWRGLSKDPSKVRDAETFGADVAAAEGVRAVWNAFFPGAGNEAHKPM
jgi:uncharacterized protein YbdZ (MbtH family)